MTYATHRSRGGHHVPQSGCDIVTGVIMPGLPLPATAQESNAFAPSARKLHSLHPEHTRLDSIW